MGEPKVILTLSEYKKLKNTLKSLEAQIATLNGQVSTIDTRLGGLKFVSVSTLPSTTDPNTIYFTDN